MNNDNITSKLYELMKRSNKPKDPGQNHEEEEKREVRRQNIDKIASCILLAGAALYFLCSGPRYDCSGDRSGREQLQNQAKSRPAATIYIDSNQTPVYAIFGDVAAQVGTTNISRGGTLDFFDENLLAKLHKQGFNNETLKGYIRSINPSLKPDNSFVQPGKKYNSLNKLPEGQTLEGLTNSLTPKSFDSYSLRSY